MRTDLAGFAPGPRRPSRACPSYETRLSELERKRHPVVGASSSFKDREKPFESFDGHPLSWCALSSSKGWMVSQNQEYISKQNQTEMGRRGTDGLHQNITSSNLTVIPLFTGYCMWLLLDAVTIPYEGAQHDFIRSAKDERGELTPDLSLNGGKNSSLSELLSTLHENLLKELANAYLSSAGSYISRFTHRFSKLCHVSVPNCEKTRR